MLFYIQEISKSKSRKTNQTSETQKSFNLWTICNRYFISIEEFRNLNKYQTFKANKILLMI